MIYFIRIICLFSLFIFFSEAQAIDELNLTRIKQNVEVKEKELDIISKEYDKIQSNINEKVSQLSSLKKRAKNLEDELQKVANDLALLQKEIAENNEHKLELNNLSKERIKNIFYKKKEKTLRIFNFISRENYLRDVFFLLKIDSHDRELLSRLAEISLQQEKKEQDLRGLLSNRDLLKRNLSIEEQAISVSLNEETKLRTALKQKKNQMEDTLSKLRAEALHLETVIKSLTGASISQTKDKRNIITNYGKANLDNTTQGEGLIKGKLELPIFARVYRPYGTHIAKGFRELVTSKGIEFSQNTAGQPVHAIFNGRVLYLGDMPAYGKVVILSHGKRYYSLYGKLLNVAVAVGDSVNKGSEIANADSFFYFEIRQEGQPINPVIFYPKGLDY